MGTGGPLNIWCCRVRDRIGPSQPTSRNQIQKAHPWGAVKSLGLSGPVTARGATRRFFLAGPDF